MLSKKLVEYLAAKAPATKQKLARYRHTGFYKTLKWLWKYIVASQTEKIIRKYVNEQHRIQDAYDLTALRQAKKIVVVLIPAEHTVYGGYMSFFSICSYSRKILPDHFVFLCTIPTYRYNINVTYAKNTCFRNNESLWRLEQLVNNAGNCERMVVHVPEICIEEFCDSCSTEEKKFFKGIKNLHINIMLQNIDLMPSPEIAHRLAEFTPNLTLTTAHKAYSTQETSDKYRMPLKYISVYFDLSMYHACKFEDKKKIILISRDRNKYKEEFISLVRCKLHDYQTIIIDNVTFDAYMQLIAEAMFTISFGEGFDAYLMQPGLVGGVGIAVYNERFFPDDSWKELENIYLSYDDLAEHFVDDVRRLEKNPQEYQSIIDAMRVRHDDIYGEEKYIGYLKKFYTEDYDFFPDKKIKKILTAQRICRVKKIYIVGGDGFARECALYILNLAKRNEPVIFGGFLGHNGYRVDFKNMDGFFRGDVAEHKFTNNEYAVIGAAFPQLRFKIYQDLKKQDIPLFTLLAHGCEVNKYVELGEGNIFAAPFQASVQMKIGNCNVFNGGVIVGHDNVIGDFNFFGPCSQILGNVSIGDYNSIGANAVLLPHSRLGNNNTISPLSVVYKGCRNNSIMHGNPAVKIKQYPVSAISAD